MRREGLGTVRSGGYMIMGDPSPIMQCVGYKVACAQGRTGQCGRVFSCMCWVCGSRAVPGRSQEAYLAAAWARAARGRVAAVHCRCHSRFFLLQMPLPVFSLRGFCGGWWRWSVEVPGPTLHISTSEIDDGVSYQGYPASARAAAVASVHGRHPRAFVARALRRSLWRASPRLRGAAQGSGTAAIPPPQVGRSCSGRCESDAGDERT